MTCVSIGNRSIILGDLPFAALKGQASFTAPG